ncbi:WD40/YVTN/BNR-like repeat-containing protein [Cohnella candidum]|uniref:Photosynthesis system II assembly factor Ycf48/Hcf136-like domain-containing protein n=1 Tax=Cohnella candidum TaxID=2674991 RepID=A0A3G3K493_9BACL|nr:hypothetical protein [Cohnella candidum]AYQ75262.1 hypothetical protein EAV92_23585 [Cohnella candidum]
MGKLRRSHTLLLLCSILLIGAAGCSAGNNGASPSGSSPVSSPAASPAASPNESASAAPTSASPPADSADPGTDSTKTGKVTAVRLANPMIGWAGGDGWIAGTADGGAHWSIQLRPQNVVHQIFALNKDKAWASLASGDHKSVKLVRTTDGGKHWEDGGTVPNDSFFHFVSDLEAFSGDAHTTDGGKTWTPMTTPGKTVGDVYFHDAKNGWAVTNGQHGFSIRKTSDGGKTWTTVLSKDSDVPPTNSVIRSAGKNDAWVEVVGGSGMSQTSYSLFHTRDGGKSWQPVLANSGAGSGPAPGFTMDEKKVPRNGGNSPGTLYVASPDVAFMGGQCQACDKPNRLGKTTDGGETWVNLKPEYSGFDVQQIAAADADHVWWINTDGQEPSKMYVTSDGGANWKLVHTFDKPSA